MERKIGEIFEYNGEWYQCVEGNDCANCVFIDYCKSYSKEERDDTIGLCVSFDRNDGMHVIFKKLEKIGEPYEFKKRIIQAYKLYTEPSFSMNTDFVFVYLNGSSTINIIIKQNKEDMEDNKLNLKSFDLQKAKKGNPVCTRDGRKARIICFDTKGDVCPIIALIEENGIEVTIHYDREGRNCYKGSNDDLMMLPEKKEGWAVIRRSDIYETEEQAKEVLLNSRVGVMIRKIEWEE